jgi:hypothetical protein
VGEAAKRVLILILLGGRESGDGTGTGTGTGTGDIRLWARYPAGPARQVPVQIFEAPAPNSNRAPPRHVVDTYTHIHPHPPPPIHSTPIYPSQTHCNIRPTQPNPPPQHTATRTPPRQPPWRQSQSAKSRAIRARAGPRRTRTSRASVCRAMDARPHQQEASLGKRPRERYVWHAAPPCAPHPLTQPGMRSRHRPGEGKEDVGPRCAARRRTRHGKDGPRPRRQPGAGDQGPLLPHCRQRNLLGRGQEDGGAHGELPASHWPACQGDKGGVRGRGDGAHARGG